MGLDIYLYKANRIPTRDDLNEEKHTSFDEENIELPSIKYPNHYFKIGYLRSSYNQSGINSVLGNLIKMDLYDIFDVDNKEYVVDPNWNMALMKTNRAINLYKEYLNSPVGKYGISTIYNFDRGTAKNSEEAFDIFKKQLENFSKNAGAFDSYSCSEGTFYLGDPLKVVGVMQTKGKFGDETYLVYEKPEFKPEDDFYLQALEVVQETIEYVLAQKDGMKYYFHWSG